jgi:hypothetical protein
VRPGALIAAALVAATFAGALAACGTRPPDLFLLERSGSIAGAQLTLRVRDDGLVSCNGGRLRRLPDRLLLDARSVASALAKPASRRVALPAGSGSVLRYRVRLAQGAVSFADDSPGQAWGMFETQALARKLATHVCGLPR